MQSVEPRAFVLPPGQSQELRVKIDLTHRFPHQFGIDRRELAVSIRPTLVKTLIARTFLVSPRR